MDGPSREAFDLFFPACRLNVRRNLKWNWKHLWWWKLVWIDTRDRVCSRPKSSGDVDGLIRAFNYGMEVGIECAKIDAVKIIEGKL